MSSRKAQRGRGRPPKPIKWSLRDGVLEFHHPDGAVYHWWTDKYHAALRAGASDKDARRSAMAATRRQFNNLSERRIQQINKRFAPLAAGIPEWVRQEVQPHVDELDAMYESVSHALQLGHASYPDLIGPAAVDRESFSRRAGALEPDAPQRLVSMLAAAFLRAHEARLDAESKLEAAEAKMKKNQTRDAANTLHPAYSARPRVNETKIPSKG